MNDISLWYALYGPPLGSPHFGPPVVLLHGGKISSRWCGHLIQYLEPSYSVVAVDTRAHGRSSDDLSVPLSYDQFAQDFVSLLDTLNVSRATVVGWSDGANTPLDLAMNYSTLIDHLIAFRANYNPNQANISGMENIPYLNDLLSREVSEHNKINPSPNWGLFSGRVDQMQSVSPMWNQLDFDRIPNYGRN